jgi:hypothetical protein
MEGSSQTDLDQILVDTYTYILISNINELKKQSSNQHRQLISLEEKRNPIQRDTYENFPIIKLHFKFTCSTKKLMT